MTLIFSPALISVGREASTPSVGVDERGQPRLDGAHAARSAALGIGRVLAERLEQRARLLGHVVRRRGARPSRCDQPARA